MGKLNFSYSPPDNTPQVGISKGAPSRTTQGRKLPVRSSKAPGTPPEISQQIKRNKTESHLSWGVRVDPPPFLYTEADRAVTDSRNTLFSRLIPEFRI